jgi:hypothetical protein
MHSGATQRDGRNNGEMLLPTIQTYGHICLHVQRWRGQRARRRDAQQTSGIDNGRRDRVPPETAEGACPAVAPELLRRGVTHIVL